MLYIRSLELENIRCFGKKQHIDFTVDGQIAQWTVILGDNGTGKTTLLKSIVAMLPSPTSFLQRRGNLDTNYDVSYNTDWKKEWKIERNGVRGVTSIKLEIEEAQKAFVSSTLNPTMSLEFHMDNRPDNDEVNEFSMRPTINTVLFSPVYCFAYGANRKVSPSSLSGKNFDRVNETLFIEGSFLQNSEEILLQSDYETAKSRKGSSEINKVKELIKKILPDGIKDIRISKMDRFQRRVEVETPYGWVDINELSMGYKTTVAWLLDFATKMIYYHRNSESPFEEPTILVLDEIDLHMHPSWQYNIMEKLSKLFPKTQFIVTAHSPLIAQAALNSNIVLLKRTGKHVEVVNDPEVVNTWRVDQVLTSDLFGIEYVRAHEVQKLLNKKNKLLSKVRLTEAEQKALEKLNVGIGKVAVYDNKYEKQAYSAIDKIAEILKSKETK